MGIDVGDEDLGIERWRGVGGQSGKHPPLRGGAKRGRDALRGGGNC